MKDFKIAEKSFDQRQEEKIKKHRAKMAEDLEALIEGGVLDNPMSLTEVIFILKGKS